MPGDPLSARIGDGLAIVSTDALSKAQLFPPYRKRPKRNTFRSKNMMDFKTGQRIHHQKRSLGAGTKDDRPTVTASTKKSFLFNPFIASVVHSSLHSRAWLALSVSMGILGAAIGHLPAYAEGSRELVDSGGDRAFLEYSTNTGSLNAGIQRKTTIKVYAAEGETINLGSSVIGTGSASLQYRKPGNSTTFTCDTSTSPVGRITSLAEEAAGPLPTV